MTEEFSPSWISFLENLLAEPGPYTDARFTSQNTVSLYLRNRELQYCRRGESAGLSVRSMTPEVTAFSSTTNLNAQTVKEMVACVKRRAEHGEGTLDLSVVPCERAEYKNNDLNHSVDDIVLWLRERIPSMDGVNTDLLLMITEEKKMFLNDKGSQLFLDVARLYFHVGAASENAGHSAYAGGDIGGLRSLEAFEEENNLTEIMESCIQRARHLSESHSSPKGVKRIILDSGLSGLLAHEVGHMFEADSHSFSPHLLKEISIPRISVRDTGEPETLYGWTPFDDEGVESREVSLIKEGNVHQNIHTLRTALSASEEPQGNGRAEKFSVLPKSRMRNTYVTGSEGWNKEEILEDSPGAFFAVGSGGGIKIDSGYFVFYPDALYKIGKKGDLEDIYPPTSLEGTVKDILENTDAVGKDLQFNPSLCQSRNQRIPVSSGGPLLRTKFRVGGY